MKRRFSQVDVFTEVPYFGNPLAVVLNAEGQREAAAETLVALMRRDRGWNDDAARKKLLDFFEAWGPKDAATLRGRRLLSGLLFA